MTSIHIQPMQWGPIHDMGGPELELFSEKDAGLFRDIRDALKRHNALARFGMFLIHKHFDVAEDEEMTECTDHAGRRLTIVPRKKADIMSKGIRVITAREVTPAFRRAHSPVCLQKKRGLDLAWALF